MGKLDQVKQVSFSNKILDYVDVRLQIMGISFPEYIRYLVLNDIKSLRDGIPFVSAAEEKRIEASMKDLTNDDFVVHKKKGDIRKHFSDLMNE